MVATKKSSKESKHKARDSDRDYAAELSRRYVEKDPYRNPIGPGGPIVEQPVDGDFLASELLRFALYGTWDKTEHHLVAERLAMRSLMRGIVKDRRKAIGVTAAIGEAMRASGRKDETVKNALYPRKKKPRRG